MGVKGILSGRGKLYDSLSKSQIDYYREYLREFHDVDGEQIRFIDWLETQRIELNTILSAAKTYCSLELDKMETNRCLA